MNLQDYLRDNKNWREDLSKPPYNLLFSEDDNLILFKYSQIASDFSLELVQQCRGIILEKDSWKVVCRPFDKFFNYGEPYAAQIDWNHAVVSEKIDGSLIKMFYYNGKWRIATNGTIDAKNAQVSVLTFYDLFKRSIERQELSIISLDKNYTHMFELVSPYSRVVIPYEATEIYYLGSRHNETGEYKDFDLKIQKPKVHKLSSLGEVIAAANALDWHNEGYVVFDGVNRVKVKSPEYVMAHYARQNGNVSLRHLIEIVRANEVDEFLTYSEDLYKDKVLFIKDLFADWGEQLDNAWDNAPQCSSKRLFVNYVHEQQLPKFLEKYLYNKYDGNNLTWTEYLVNMKVRPLEVYIRDLYEWKELM